MSFTIIVIPDTQYLAWKPALNEHYTTMADWIVASKSDLNIQAVIHVGDLTERSADTELAVAGAAIARIKGAGIPFITCRGNHDTQVSFNQYFGFETFQEFSIIGKYSESDACNYYVEVEIEEEPYLFFALDFGPTDAVMEWAANEIGAHPNHHVMIVTHSYMFYDGTRVGPETEYNPKSYLGSAVNTGEEMWQDYLRHLPNVECIFSGHHGIPSIPPYYSYRVDLNDAGLAAFQAFQNWQYSPRGGSGKVCVYEITPHKDPVSGDRYDLSMRVYDPVLGQYVPEYDLQVRYGSIIPWLMGDMSQFTQSRFSRPGTQVRLVSVDLIEATVNATRAFTAAPRSVEVEIQGGTLDALAYLAADPAYLVPGARRFGLTQFSAPGSLQSRSSAVAGDEGSLVSTRTPLVAADRNAAIAAAGGYQAGKSYALPDVSGGVSATFEEVYPV